MKHVYENFDIEYDETFCDNCKNCITYVDWDEGGPEVMGGMQPTRVVVHECLLGSSRSKTECLIPKN